MTAFKLPPQPRAKRVASQFSGDEIKTEMEEFLHAVAASAYKSVVHYHEMYELTKSDGDIKAAHHWLKYLSCCEYVRNRLRPFKRSPTRPIDAAAQQAADTARKQGVIVDGSTRQSAESRTGQTRGTNKQSQAD